MVRSGSTPTGVGRARGKSGAAGTIDRNKLLDAWGIWDPRVGLLVRHREIVMRGGDQPALGSPPWRPAVVVANVPGSTRIAAMSAVDESSMSV